MHKTASRKISFITTVYNESATIVPFLNSLFAQTKMPNEIIIVDGGSTDETIQLIKDFEQKAKKMEISFYAFIKKGNRSVGRNAAIEKAKGDIIVCSDAGNILDKKWIEKIIGPFSKKKTDVVAGYYKGETKSIFQKALLPFVFVMPDNVNPKDFLPATRSIAFTKKIWEKIGGFDESLSHNEDYAFARKLREIQARIVFAKDAIVYWLPRNNFHEAFIMFFRFAYGDAEANILRPKVLLLFARYLLSFYLILLCLLYKSIFGALFILMLFAFYIVWSIVKNYRYVLDLRGLYLLPELQFTADAAVLSGTTIAYWKNIRDFRDISFKGHWFLFFILFVYCFILLLTLQWGMPNSDHPFPYHMDEWHQLQAVGNTFRYGTPNTDGSANGTMFHFLFSGFYLAPFTILQIINPFDLQIDNPLMRQRIFEVLRLQTIIYGVLSIVMLYKIAILIKAAKNGIIFFFTFAPIWLALSGYFKYDIALIFWILVSLYFLLRFMQNPSSITFVVSAIPIAFAICVKISAIPLISLYLLTYFFFSPSWRKNLIYLFFGMSIIIAAVLLFGMPDTLFGKGNILYYLYDNILHTPNTTANYHVGIDPFMYLFVYHLPLMFGLGLTVVFILSLFCLIFGFKYLSIFEKKVLAFLSGGFALFTLSLLPLKYMAIGNRSLVLLPFIVLIVSVIWKHLFQQKILRHLSLFLLPIAVALQLYTAFVWVQIKFVASPQEIASYWLQHNIPANTIIGVENIPIYQYLPHIVQKEFYFKQYKVKHDARYTYKVVDSSSKHLPQVIIVTNETMEKLLIPDSPKNKLVTRLNAEGYKQKQIITPNFLYLSLIARESDFYLSGIVTVPVTTTIYQKNN